MGKKVLSTLLIAVALLFVVSFSACDGAPGGEAQEVDLSFKPKVGAKYSYEVKLNNNISAGMSSQQNITIGSEVSVLSRDGNNTALKLQVKDVKLDMTAMGRRIVYDNKNAAVSNINLDKQLANLVYNITLDASGEVKNSEVKSEDVATEEVFGQVMSGKNVLNMVIGNLNVLPGKTIRVGDTWKKTTSSDAMMFHMDVEATYTLQSIKDGKAEVSVAANITGTKSEQAGTSMPSVTFELKGTQTGHLTVNVADGWILSGEMKQSSQGHINAQGMNVPISITGIVSTTGKVK